MRQKKKKVTKKPAGSEQEQLSAQAQAAGQVDELNESQYSYYTVETNAGTTATDQSSTLQQVQVLAELENSSNAGAAVAEVADPTQAATQVTSPDTTTPVVAEGAASHSRSASQDQPSTQAVQQATSNEESKTIEVLHTDGQAPATARLDKEAKIVKMINEIKANNSEVGSTQVTVVQESDQQAVEESKQSLPTNNDDEESKEVELVVQDNYAPPKPVEPESTKQSEIKEQQTAVVTPTGAKPDVKVVDKTAAAAQATTTLQAKQETRQTGAMNTNTSQTAAPVQTRRPVAPARAPQNSTGFEALRDKFSALGEEKKRQIAVGGAAVVGLVVTVGAYMLFRRR